MAQGVSKWDSSPEPPGRGLVQVFTGDGKGKTTAALGAVVRALGQGRRVYIVFFMKGDYPYGERNILAQLANVEIASFGSLDFVDPASVRPEDREQAQLALSAAREAMLNFNVPLNLEDTKTIIKKLKEKIDILDKYYFCDPSVFMLSTSNCVYVEPYPIRHVYETKTHLSGYSPLLKIEKGSSLFDAWNSHFDLLWESLEFE